jgi:trans-2,3-dihydro-3-hydroxyanthranilate isomerase
VDQGIEMGRPSRLEIEADKHMGAVTAIRVGGASVIVSEGTMTLPAGG